MATTTNYGWPTPNDTDLVKDGAAAIRSLGQSIDTTFAELKGGTSGQMLTKASNTDNDYAWVTPEIGDITAVVAAAPLTGGGTSGSVNIGIQDGTTTQKGAVQLEDSTASTSTVKAATPNSVKSAYDLANAAIPKSVATTAGDILYRNGSTVTRLGIGTAGQVLKVNSGATAPEWGTNSATGGLTFIASSSFSASSAVNINNCFSSTYENYKVVIALDSASADISQFNLRLRASGTDSTTGYSFWGLEPNSTSPTIYDFRGNPASYGAFGYQGMKGGLYTIDISRPFVADYTTYTSLYVAIHNSLGAISGFGNGSHEISASYDGFTITAPSGNITGTIRIYGYANS